MAKRTAPKQSTATPRKRKVQDVRIAGWATKGVFHRFVFTISVAHPPPADIMQDSARYIVTYGAQTMADLDYSRAAYELGRSILHALHCDGAFDG